MYARHAGKSEEMQKLTSLCYVILVKMSIGSDSLGKDATEVNSRSELDHIIEKQKQNEMSTHLYLNGPAVGRRTSRPISIPRATEKNDDSVCRLSAKYDLATWNMYNRIMDHRTRMAREGMTSTFSKNESSASSSKRLKRKNTDKLNPSENSTHDACDCKDCCNSEAEDNDCLQFQLDED